ncbi:LacI family DNA-binding transcriptional regulator [Oscillospiraceae bacterium PP1C4]
MTLKEIAQALNVSPSTVSLVLNQKTGVSQSTRSKVLAMLGENGYAVVPLPKSESARRHIRFLKYVKHSMIVDGNEGFVASIIDSAEREARKKGFNFVMTSFREDMLDEVFKMVREDPLDGIILLGTELERQHFHYLDQLNVPLVVVDNHLQFYSADSVIMNNEDIVYMALEHLAKLGHREIGYLHSNVEIANFSERCCAYGKALETLGIPYNPNHVYQVGATMQGTYDSIMKLLQAGVKFPSGIFSDNDTIALGFIKAVKSYGYRIPEDISVIGFDDIPFCTMSDPPLTTMRVPTEDIGIWTVRRLCYRMTHPDAPVMKMQFGADLVCRESTRACQK